jgi:hypothetical protein
MRIKNHIGTTKFECIVCGNKFSDFKSNKRKYCSRKCYNISPTRGTHPFNRRKEKCEWCLNVFERPVSNFKAKKHNFCSRRCASDWWAEFGLHGKDNPNWSGGYSQKEYSNGWARIKKEVRKRADGKCEKCGGIHKLMDVHHLIPVRLKKDIKIMNDLCNLQFLCRPCHIEAEFLLRGGYSHQTKISA